jgi:hypothetical protein
MGQQAPCQSRPAGARSHAVARVGGSADRDDESDLMRLQAFNFPGKCRDLPRLLGLALSR